MKKEYLEKRRAFVADVLKLKVDSVASFEVPADGVTAFRTAIAREVEKLNLSSRKSVPFKVSVIQSEEKAGVYDVCRVS